jgi:hypothetical protein
MPTSVCSAACDVIDTCDFDESMPDLKRYYSSDDELLDDRESYVKKRSFAQTDSSEADNSGQGSTRQQCQLEKELVE